MRATGELGWFKITGEAAIAAGIRRIEAVAGTAVADWARTESARQDERFSGLLRKKNELPPLPEIRQWDQPATLLEEIEARATHLRRLEGEVHDWEKQQAKAAESALQQRAAAVAEELAGSLAGATSCVAHVPEAEGNLLQAVADLLKTRVPGPVVLAGSHDGRVHLVANVPKGVTPGANQIIQEMAPLVGGKGGGRPENARGSGKDVSRIDEALAKARLLLGLA